MAAELNERRIVRLLKTSKVLALIGGLIAGLLLVRMNATVGQITLAMVVFAGLQLNLLIIDKVVSWIRTLNREFLATHLP